LRGRGVFYGDREDSLRRVEARTVVPLKAVMVEQRGK
jgi:hypothetical protein